MNIFVIIILVAFFLDTELWRVTSTVLLEFCNLIKLLLDQEQLTSTYLYFLLSNYFLYNGD